MKLTNIWFALRDDDYDDWDDVSECWRFAKKGSRYQSAADAIKAARDLGVKVSLIMYCDQGEADLGCVN